MKPMRFFILICLLCSGCGMIPTRLFQKAVPPPVAKQPAQIEAERQSADLLAHGITAPISLVPVAQGLSESLGKPANPLPSATPEQVDQSAGKALEALTKQIGAMQKQIDAQNKFLAKYAGTKLEGTGIDLMGPGMIALVLGLIVLGFVCPPALTVMFFIMRRAKAALGTVVNGIEDAAKSPELKSAVAAVKENIGERMKAHPQQTTALKAVITNLKT